MMTRLKFYFFVLLLCFSSAEAAARFLKTKAIPGGVVVMSLGKVAKRKPNVSFHENRVLVTKKNKKWWAVVGIPLNTKSGTQHLKLKTGSKIFKKYFSVQSHKYATQRLTIRKRKQRTSRRKTKAKVRTTSPKRVFADRKKLTAALKRWTHTSHVDLPFRKPLQGRISSVFGLKRVLNGKPSGRHMGVDLAAPRGTPIRASGKGLVADTGHYRVSGKAVVLDHGKGLVTVYCHLSRIKVKPGQTVKRGQIIGRVGTTGRSTGPHLHWGAILNHTKVNPLLLVSKNKH